MTCCQDRRDAVIQPACGLDGFSFDYREVGLPGYLQHDLDAYKEGVRTGSTLLDCLWCELYGSINGAEIDDQAITHAHAEYLRDKFLRGRVA